MTKHELLQKLRNLDPVFLIELLKINSDDIVDAFLDLIEDNYNYLHEQVDDIDNGTEEE